MSAALADPVTRTLNHFQAVREGARRHHGEVGRDVNPDHCFGDFLVTVSQAKAGPHDIRGKARDKLATVYKSALAEASGTAGGYTVPVDFREELMRDVSDIAVVRPRATVTSQTSLTMLVPMPNAATAQGQNVAPFYGGFNAVVQTENNAWAEADNSFEQVELQAALIGGYVVGSNNLINDARGLEAWLRMLFAAALAWSEDWYCINSGPAVQGIIGCPAAIKYTRATTNTFVAGDAQGMLNAHHKLSSVMLSEYDAERGDGKQSALWIMNRALASQLTTFTNWFPNGSFELYGMPIALTTKQPKLGTQGDVILADLSFYLLSDRQEQTVDFSPYDPTPYLKNQSSWRVYERIGAAPMLAKPITLTDGSNNAVSPFVILNSNPAVN